ncbi:MULTISPECIES: hypothetical protein [unclassified Lysobacter]|uniref:hypothetical protein n=1 Tax=unclassified Lysobacter TaxID=2635362 RepID=UPI000A70D5AC|nr:MULTISPECIES: hypothetical protein [unclassified Lysobacter]
MNRYLSSRGLAVMAAVGLCALTGYASAGRDAEAGVPMSERVTKVGVGAAVAARPDGWPEAVPLPEGVQIDGARCANRYCTLWFGLMNYDQMVALRRDYVALINDSKQWERLGVDYGPFEPHAYRYTGTMPAGGCGYTVEMRSGSISGDALHRFRVHLTVTW